MEGPRRAPEGAAGELVWESNLGVGLEQQDDDCELRAIGFPFVFYGQTYENVWINSNGNLTFNGCEPEWWHPDIPDGANVIVAPLYGDFDPEVAGEMFFNTIGSEPNRRLVVTWSGVPEYSEERDPTLPPSTFQVWLFEGSNSIQFGYNGLGTEGVQWEFHEPATDARMDVGISSSSGSFINSANGTGIPSLDLSNICYVPQTSGYQTIMGSCCDPQCPDDRIFCAPSLALLEDLWSESNPVSDRNQPTGNTVERAGWVVRNGNSYSIDQWTGEANQCKRHPAPEQQTAPDSARAHVHTHPLMYGIWFPGPICERDSIRFKRDASKFDKNIIGFNADLPHYIIDWSGVIRVDPAVPGGSDPTFDGCING